MEQNKKIKLCKSAKTILTIIKNEKASVYSLCERAELPSERRVQAIIIELCNLNLITKLSETPLVGRRTPPAIISITSTGEEYLAQIETTTLENA